MSTVSPHKVLLVGRDAADWKVIHPLLNAGKTPQLARFSEQGVMGNIATHQPALSPPHSTSIATGKRSDKHGTLGFSPPDPVTGGIRPIINSKMRLKLTTKQQIKCKICYCLGTLYALFGICRDCGKLLYSRPRGGKVCAYCYNRF
ncbi:MAG: hypothetical protein DVB26_04400 [Verrucomicrobia bacterium]|nr:MAG: hypothetical protein DVB26_04400 [Verrucomicrobiota bacterium]